MESPGKCARLVRVFGAWGLKQVGGAELVAPGVSTAGRLLLWGGLHRGKGMG